MKKLLQGGDRPENGSITLIFHGNLVDILINNGRDASVTYTYTQKTAVKHIIESLGVPHPEIDTLECAGQQVPLNYAVHDGDIIHIYPISSESRKLTREQVRFVLDNHLGKLSDYMRLLGFDTVYAQDWSDAAIAACAFEQHRILLTRDHGLLKRKIVEIGHCVRADEPIDQLKEVVELFNLQSFITPFRRCPHCNGSLEPVSKQDIMDQLLPLTRKYYEEFTQCIDCGQIYWKGSHYERMLKMFASYTEFHQENQ